MFLCYECSTPFTPTPPLRDQVCTSCGECPAQQCRDCGHHYAELHDEERCEECFASHERVEAMERRDAMREAKGDWLRDEGKDRRWA